MTEWSNEQYIKYFIPFAHTICYPELMHKDNKLVVWLVDRHTLGPPHSKALLMSPSKKRSLSIYISSFVTPGGPGLYLSFTEKN